MKNYYMITKEATKYWKKAIKNDRIMVTQHDGIIYIVNGYNAFKFPAVSAIWDDLARPAFMVEMPAEGEAFSYFNGRKNTAVSSNIVDILDRNLTDKTTAVRSPFTYDCKDLTVRLYKNTNGSISGINVKYDAMVDPSQVKEIYCGGRYSPVVFINGEYTALVMPVRTGDGFPDIIRDTFAKVMEA